MYPRLGTPVLDYLRACALADLLIRLQCSTFITLFTRHVDSADLQLYNYIEWFCNCWGFSLCCLSKKKIARKVLRWVLFEGCSLDLAIMGVCRGAKRAFAPLEIGCKNQKFLINLKSGACFRLIHVIRAMIVHLLVWHSQCTRRRFTVLV